MTVHSECWVIKLDGHAFSDKAQVPMLDVILIAVQIETESILHHLEQHHDLKPVQ